MLKGQPKGLFVLAMANMGERFGYYTMLAIFVFYMQAKFGFDSSTTSTIFGTFLALVYFLPLVGGIVADKVLGYGKTIALGIIIMFFGYLLLAIPTGADAAGMYMMFGALALICLGTGFFKGNLQALVGNLYDDPKYSSKRDLAFSIFYMCINIGAFFAPTAASAVQEHFMTKDGFVYNSNIPALAHQLFDGKITPEGTAQLTQFMADQPNAAQFTDLTEFGHQYIASLSQSYNFGFGVACISLIISIAVFLGFRKFYKAADVTEKQKAKAMAASGEKSTVVELTPAQTRERLVALGLVFFVVIFFWMAFHQNGLTLSYFARDYTAKSVMGFDRFGFSLMTLVPFAIAFYGLLSLIQSTNSRGKLVGGSLMVVFGGVAYWAYSQMTAVVSIQPQIFQQFNAFFIILLTPVAVAFFTWLNKRSMEPSAPRKIGIGMLITAAGFMFLAFNSLGLPTPDAVTAAGGLESNMFVSPNVLISTYFLLTIAELFLSPMGISFVSKVAPPKYKGMAQGGWLAATAVGNYLVAIIGYLWGGLPLWILWAILVVCCLLSASFIFGVMKKLEKATNNA